MFAELVSNLSILVILGVLSFYFKGFQLPLNTKNSILVGILYGIVTIVGMNIPFTFSEGLIFDGRSVIICMAAFFFGNIATVVIVAISSIYRIVIGGAGVYMGISVILSSAILGLFFNYLHSKKIISRNIIAFLVLGLTVHICMILLMILLPSGVSHKVFVNISPWIILLYVPFTIVFGVILNNQERNIKNHLLLKESEERYRSIFENSTLGIYRTSPEGNILLANSALINMLGFDSFEDLVKVNLEATDYGKSNERKQFREQIEKIGYVKGFEATWTKKNGESISVLESARAFKDNLNRVIYYEGIVEDITKRKQIEAELKQSEALFRSLTQEAPVGIFRTDEYGNTTFVNPLWSRITDLSLSEAKGLGWLNAIHPDDYNKVKIEWARAIEKVEPSIMEYRFLRKDNSIAWVSGKAVPQLNEEGKLLGYIGTATDITSKKIAEEELKESEIKFRKLIEFAPVGVIVSDNDQNTLFVNKKFVELTGYTIENHPSVNEWWSLAYPDKDYRNKLMKEWNDSVEKAITNKTEIIPIECMVRCKNGEDKFFEIGFVSIGEINIVTFIDLTERKLTEVELLKLKDSLEEKVNEQTLELKKKIQELEEFREITLSREFRIAELKEEIKSLKEKGF